jgi:hypothetical protein
MLLWETVYVVLIYTKSSAIYPPIYAVLDNLQRAACTADMKHAVLQAAPASSIRRLVLQIETVRYNR